MLVTHREHTCNQHFTEMGMIVNGFINVVISNLEKRYELSSTETGLIASFYDIATVLCLIPVSYFGGLGCKPRYIGIGVFFMGVGSFIFALPQFVSGIYQPLDDGDIICNGTTTVSSCDQNSGLSDYKYVFFLAQILLGIGASPLYTLGITYLDDNLSVRSSALYIGIYSALVVFGPAIGYLAGGAFLELYVDIDKVDLSSISLKPTSARYVGAWWIGFLISSVLALVIAYPLCGFPSSLPVFMPKFVETQFSLKASTAATYVVIGKLRLALVLSMLCVVSCLAFLVHCDDLPFAGVNLLYGESPKNGSMEFIGKFEPSPCNSDCHCTLENYNPVCGPILFGKLIDMACKLWQSNCDNNGSCFFYNKKTMSYSLLAVGISGKALYAFFTFLSIQFYRPTEDEKEASLSAEITFNKENCETCGWGPLKPTWCQRFRNPPCVLVWLCFAGAIQGMVVNGFVNVVISSVERRYELSSTESGFIASSYDVAVVLCLLPITYFGGFGCKPRYLGIGLFIIGLGSFVFTIPHYVVGVYTPGTGDESALCSSNSSSTQCTPLDSKLSDLKYFFYLGQFLHGIGATPLYTLGYTYLFENLPLRSSSLYFALLVGGFSTFSPKFIESQFSVTSSTAALYVGAVTIPAGGGGTLLGGYLIKRFNLRVRGIIKITKGFLGSFEKGTCNANCNCGLENYKPVCGIDGVTYYSPCHAGCEVEISGDKMKYHNCSCLTYYKSNTSLLEYTAQADRCKSDCWYLPLFLPIFTVMVFLTFIPETMAVAATLRCLPQEERSVGMGVQSVIARCLGSIPGPVLKCLFCYFLGSIPGPVLKCLFCYF
ncbi:hypothetical protein KUTeg_000411 [Tegillarca granosa]|uniref:Kazal-like domain-containing protein n=1 Tax=Tegillarca granosa TaxID=220873 RepID=A0ABQ9G092_TEGGR|nr:hypothetical protein KUTeg_000411 [Tegillarca granosa]